MKLIVECDVESKIILPRRLELIRNGRSFIFQVDGENRWIKLKVVSSVPDASRFKWGIEPVPKPKAGQAPCTVHARPERELFDTVISDIQCLESAISVFYPVRNIDWRHPTINVELEDGDPRDRSWGGLGEVHWGAGTLPPARPTEKDFVTVACLGLVSESLVVVESFWREGENERLAGKHINAFYNYYFVLEGLYGNGKKKNKQIEDNLKASTELCNSIGLYLSSPQPEHHIKQVFDMLPSQKKSCLPTAETLISLLVSTRGRLHHFANNPNRSEGSPLVHDQYEAITTMARFLAHKAIVAVATKIQAVGFVERI